MRSGRLAETPVSFFFCGRALLLARREPSTVWGFGADGSGFRGWTFHASATYRGWFGIHVLNLPRWRSISWMVRCPGLDLPRLGPESWTVRCPRLDLPRLVPISWTVRDPCVEPSTLKVDIADGSILQDRTFHVSVPYRGQFGIHVLNHPRLVPISWTVQYPGANLPRLGPESRMVRVSGVEPSTVEVDIVDGSGFRAGPSTLRA